MARPWVPATDDTQLNSLQHAVNEARSDSKTIKVDREALRRLLLDHHDLTGRLQLV